MRVYILPVRETVVGGPRGGEASFNGLLKEINGLQMAQSIYSNETPSVAMSIEQSAGGRRRGGGAKSPQVMTTPHSKDSADLDAITCQQRRVKY